MSGWMSDRCQADVRQMSGRCQAWMSGRCQADVRQMMPGRYQADVRPLNWPRRESRSVCNYNYIRIWFRDDSLFQDSGSYVSSPAGVGVWVVPGGRGWTPTFAIVAVFAAPAGVGAWVVPGGRGWTPNYSGRVFRSSSSIHGVPATRA